MPSAAQECREPSGITNVVREFHMVWRVVTLLFVFHCNYDLYLAPFLVYSASKNVVTLKARLGFVQRH